MWINKIMTGSAVVQSYNQRVVGSIPDQLGSSVISREIAKTVYVQWVQSIHFYRIFKNIYLKKKTNLIDFWILSKINSVKVTLIFNNLKQFRLELQVHMF